MAPSDAAPPPLRSTPAGSRPVAALSRRQILVQGALGLGPLAVGSLLARDAAANDPLSGLTRAANPQPQWAPRAKSVIFLHMVGAPSQVDLFDHKPQLAKYHGQLMPESLWQGLQLAFIRERPHLLGSPFRFRRYGQSGLELSELLPHLAKSVDHLAIIKSMHTDQINHAPAQLLMHTGFARFGRPCFGSWVSYGLGSENDDLPTFVVMNTGSIAGAGNSLWGSGFLPTIHQGVEFRSDGDPVLFLSNPPGVSRERRGRIVSAVNELNRLQLADVGDPEIATRIRQYEMAFRMQSSVPELMDTQSEPESIHRMYGTQPGQPSFANNCLLARRLVERGVRFVQLYDEGWDAHNDLRRNLPKKCREVDRPIAALITDLEQRGLLDQTLIVFASEFGRTPMAQGKPDRTAGRDHHRHAFTAWLAGGGTRGGQVVGSTDELGFNVTDNPVHVNDLHATLLHLLGLDHLRLTFKYQGRQFRLTDVGGRVVPQVFSA